MHKFLATKCYEHWNPFTSFLKRAGNLHAIEAGLDNLTSLLVGPRLSADTITWTSRKFAFVCGVRDDGKNWTRGFRDLCSSAHASVSAALSASCGKSCRPRGLVSKVYTYQRHSLNDIRVLGSCTCLVFIQETLVSHREVVIHVTGTAVIFSSV